LVAVVVLEPEIHQAVVAVVVATQVSTVDQHFL
jgi:hypothetical protein